MNIKYYVSPEKGLVVGVCETSIKQILYNNIQKKIGNCTQSSKKDFYYLFRTCVPVTIRAKAICQEMDEFDIEYGKKLVEAKISLKANKIALKELNRLALKAKDLSGVINTMWTYHQNKVYKITDDLTDYFEVVMH